MTDIPVNYDPKTIEDKWYEFWMNHRLFETDPKSKNKPYTILQPPPNVTSALHIGHAIDNTFQDILIRAKKLQGFNTLWVSGTDHGGIATEQMVKKSLFATRGLTKEQIGRGNFNMLIWKWKDEKAKIITDQIKKLGCACDWSREQFTLSPKLSNWVNFVFKQLYDQNLIYRGLYPINYCTSCGTALANDEVEHEHNTGKLYHINYNFEDDSNNYITVATTRPETLLGDVAIACNPNDDRYKHLVGRKVIVPFVNRSIPIIADDYVKFDFGTGLVKITPSHDKNDYEVSKRHNLQSIDIINKKGKIFNTKTMFDDMSTQEARIKIIEELKLLNQYNIGPDYENQIGVCYRCKNQIETLLSEQWFVRMEKLREQALELVTNDKIRFVPNEHKDHIIRWLSNDVDWCISRSIWWGHQIPIWYCQDCNHINCSLDMNIKKCQKCISTNIKRDPDVLDTWFSSALWAFSVFDSEQELKYYFPSNVLVTGSDILFFWVARMIMMTAETHHSIPFKEVFLHGIVRDKDGVKMSKTLGNGIDPMDIINEYSADILRFTLMHSTHLGHDINVGKESFEIGKTFCTKLWNSVRYILSNIGTFKCLPSGDIPKTTHIDNWILNKLNNIIEIVEHSLDNYDFGEAARKLYSFVWDDFCNCYLECAKGTIDNQVTKQVLLRVIDTLILLLHPFIPFLTEEIYQMIKVHFSELKHINSIMLRSWPKIFNIKFDSEEDKLFVIHRDITRIIRQVKGNFEVNKHDLIDVILNCDNDDLTKYIQNTAIYIKKMCSVKDLSYDQTIDANKKYIIEKQNGYTLYFPVNEKYKVNKIIKNIESRIVALNQKNSKLTETLSTLESKKKKEKFEQNINDIKKEIEELEEKIKYYKGLIVPL